MQALAVQGFEAKKLARSYPQLILWQRVPKRGELRPHVQCTAKDAIRMKHELCMGVYSCKTRNKKVWISHILTTIVSGHWTEANPASVTFWSGCSQEAAGYPQRQQLCLLGQLRQPPLGHNQAVHFHRGRTASITCFFCGRLSKKGGGWSQACSAANKFPTWWTDEYINLNYLEFTSLSSLLQWNLLLLLVFFCSYDVLFVVYGLFVSGTACRTRQLLSNQQRTAAVCTW